VFPWSAAATAGPLLTLKTHNSRPEGYRKLAVVNKGYAALQENRPIAQAFQFLSTILFPRIRNRDHSGGKSF
jgi:hypothetical protein